MRKRFLLIVALVAGGGAVLGCGPAPNPSSPAAVPPSASLAAIASGTPTASATASPSPSPSASPSPTVVPIPTEPLNGPSLGPNIYWLPSDPTLVLGPDATPLACAGVGKDAFLRGSVNDARHVWLEDATSHARSELVWPPGFAARFTPDLEVLDATGTVVMRAGYRVTGVCVGAGADWIPLQ